jgi:hypothetical protein
MDIIMKIKYFIIVIFLIAFSINNIYGEDKEIEEFEGVVTLLNIPAKLIQINKIIENPKPGTSYIADEGIIVEIDEIPEIMANWTVVNVKYYQYLKPKVITYKLFSEESKVTVEYHSVSIDIIGDLSSYIKE